MIIGRPLRTGLLAIHFLTIVGFAAALYIGEHGFRVHIICLGDNISTGSFSAHHPCVQGLAFLLQFTLCVFGLLYFSQLGLLAMTLCVVPINFSHSIADHAGHFGTIG